ncbi:MAG: GH3 family domain-containing protein, partial [Pirellulales bacterium]
MSLAGWLNTAWMMSCLRERRAFRQSTRRVAETQTELLWEMLRANRDAKFGRDHGFASIRSVGDYQARVPLSGYEHYRSAIDRIAAGERNVLTRDAVRLLEPTSGSTTGEKLIPYTAALRRQFQRGIAAWIGDLFRNRPAVRQGRAYWSISPAMGSRRTAGGIPIGFDDDAAYLGPLQQWAARRLFAVPSGVSKVGQLDSFAYCTLLGLLAADDLALISVWSPTFLCGLFHRLEEWSDRLCRDLREGTVCPPTPIPPRLARRLRLPGGVRGGRAEHVRRALRRSGAPAERFHEIWPRLAMISCWADAASAFTIGELAGLFPQVEIQPKGLIATEGFVSLPLVGQPAPALSLRSHFFEFEESDGRQ